MELCGPEGSYPNAFTYFIQRSSKFELLPRGVYAIANLRRITRSPRNKIRFNFRVEDLRTLSEHLKVVEFPPVKMLTIKRGYAYYFVKFWRHFIKLQGNVSKKLGEVWSEIRWKSSYFIRSNFAASESTYGVFPKHGERNENPLS